MSAHRHVTIFCDWPNCGRWEDQGIGDSAKQAREQLAGTGWRTGVSRANSNRGRSLPQLDYCPLHAEAPQEGVPR